MRLAEVLGLLLLTGAWGAAGNGATRSTKTWPVCVPLTLPMGAPGPFQPWVLVELPRQLAGSWDMGAVPARSTSIAVSVVHSLSSIQVPGGHEQSFFLGLLQIITP